jgi:hypothetical protein
VVPDAAAVGWAIDARGFTVLPASLVLVGNKLLDLKFGLVVGVATLAVYSCSFCSPSKRF